MNGDKNFVSQFDLTRPCPKVGVRIENIMLGKKKLFLSQSISQGIIFLKKVIHLLISFVKRW